MRGLSIDRLELDAFPGPPERAHQPPHGVQLAVRDGDPVADGRRGEQLPLLQHLLQDVAVDPRHVAGQVEGQLAEDARLRIRLQVRHDHVGREEIRHFHEDRTRRSARRGSAPRMNQAVVSVLAAVNHSAAERVDWCCSSGDPAWGSIVSAEMTRSRSEICASWGLWSRIFSFHLRTWRSMRATARSIDEYMSSVVSLALITRPLGSVMLMSATWLNPRSTENTACAAMGSL